mmetsp:Transcript_103116/g.295828  ORF Transcript_103116/g.295828 Transcript_103116/m.295828 type:complete len:333 (+) Transcript_103116:824-1822(+)
MPVFDLADELGTVRRAQRLLVHQPVGAHLHHARLVERVLQIGWVELGDLVRRQTLNGPQHVVDAHVDGSQVFAVDGQAHQRLPHEGGQVQRHHEAVAAGEADELAQERHVAQPRNGKVVRVKHNLIPVDRVGLRGVRAWLQKPQDRARLLIRRRLEHRTVWAAMVVHAFANELDDKCALLARVLNINVRATPRAIAPTRRVPFHLTEERVLHPIRTQLSLQRARVGHDSIDLDDGHVAGPLVLIQRRGHVGLSGLDDLSPKADLGPFEHEPFERHDPAGQHGTRHTTCHAGRPADRARDSSVPLRDPDNTSRGGPEALRRLQVNVRQELAHA